MKQKINKSTRKLQSDMEIRRAVAPSLVMWRCETEVVVGGFRRHFSPGGGGKDGSSCSAPESNCSIMLQPCDNMQALRSLLWLCLSPSSPGLSLDLLLPSAVWAKPFHT